MSITRRRAPATTNVLHAEAQLAFEQHRHALRQFLTRRVQGREDAKDLLQEVFVRILSVSPETVIRNPRAYLYGVAELVVREFTRRRRRNPVSYDSELLDSSSGTNEPAATGDYTDGISIERRLHEVLSRLPATHLKVLIAERRDGLTVDQIAEKFGLSNHTVRKYISQSLVQIREVWEE